MCTAELCGLLWGNVDISSRNWAVLGNGDKTRELYFSSTTSRAIADYRRPWIGGLTATAKKRQQVVDRIMIRD